MQPRVPHLFRFRPPLSHDRKRHASEWPRWEREMLSFLARHGFKDNTKVGCGIKALSAIARDMADIQTWRNVVWAEVVPMGAGYVGNVLFGYAGHTIGTPNSTPHPTTLAIQKVIARRG